MTTLYTSDHEWISIEGDIATIGVTDYAQSQLGDLVFVELPKVGRTLKKAEAAAGPGGVNATIGATDYAQSQLADVVFVELPKVGRTLKKAKAAAVVESVKAASDVY